MGVLLTPKVAIVLAVVGAAIIGGIIAGVYHWKIALETNKFVENPSQHGIPDDDGLMGDDPKAGTTQISNQTICAGKSYECNIRLDENVKPIHYDLYLNPDIERGVFTGSVAIALKIYSTVDHIRLHTKYLNISETKLFHGMDEIVILKSFEILEKEYWVIVPAEPLERSRYNLTLQFGGSLTRGITGFYRANYTEDGQTKFVVSTKFQPTSARKAFPCFDEPGFKSTFTISLVKPTELVALSNMPVDLEVPDMPAGNLTTVIFQRSEKMVTYLVVVAIGEFESVNSMTKRKTPVRIFATKSQVNKTRYAAEIAPKMIDYFEDYFKVEFPLPKLDIIGIPDFVSGAMEHWGLISFREANLLYQPGVASAANKQRIASVISHELAHMWFGNLVTMAWWDDLYLNEGFASFMEYKGVQSVHPDWEIESQFGALDLSPVLKLDGKQSSHPIVQEVHHPDQITEIFDTISYNKGSSVIRMLENFMTPERFRHGITEFLDQFSFKNAGTQDLWNYLQEEVSKINISLIMNTWTKQMSYPIVNVAIQNGTAKLTQERFMENRYILNTLKHEDKKSPYNYTWEIPIYVADNTSEYSLFWIHHNQKSIELPFSQNTNWIKINRGQYGYYRVNYEESIWKELKNVYHSRFLPVERCGLLDDALSLSMARYLNYSTALDFVTVVKDESHFVPWDCLDSHLRQLSRLLRNAAPSTYPLYKKWITKITSNVYRSLNWTDFEEDPHLGRLLKTIIFSLSCENGDTACLAKTKELFNEYLVNPPTENKIPPSLRAIVYKWGMWQSNETAWDTIWERYQTETDAQEKLRLLSCLTSTKETWIIQRLLDRSKQESIVRRQDFFILARYIAQNPVGNPILWKFYRNEYKYLVKRFSNNDRYFGRMILDITDDYANKIQLREIQSLFKNYPEAGAGRRAREIALENVENNIEWISLNAKVVEQWLMSYLTASASP